MAKAKQVMSIAIEPDLQEELKEYCKTKGLSISSYICLLISKGIKISIEDDPIVIGKPSDEDVIPVVLKIPKKHKGDKANLKAWMDAQTNGIVNKLG